jgi:hypothetical protein
MGDSIINVIVPAASGLLGAVLGSIVPFLLNKRTSKVEYELKKAELDRTYNYRFGDAVARLQDDSLGVRIGALYELEKLGLDPSHKHEQEAIVQILSPYIKKRIEKPEYLHQSDYQPAYYQGLRSPENDVFIAGTIVSLFFGSTSRRASLGFLKADEIDGYRIKLEGACLYDAHFERARLVRASLKRADLRNAHFKETILNEANLEGADLRYADKITAEQLLSAHIDNTTLLDPDLRAEYERLKAEQQ